MISRPKNQVRTALTLFTGALVLSGGLVGRITSVDDHFISIDYSYPFGGEALFCDILVESAKPGTK